MNEIQQILSGVMTGLLLIIFIGICLWSWSSKRKESFDEMARLPLDDSEKTEEHADKSEASI